MVSDIENASFLLNLTKNYYKKKQEQPAGGSKQPAHMNALPFTDRNITNGRIWKKIAPQMKLGAKLGAADDSSYTK